MDNEFTIHRYRSNPWKELPIDGSLNQLATELGCSRNLVRSAISKLEPDKEPSQDETLYNRIVNARKGETRDKYDLTGGTYPAALYWESKELVSALVRARKNNRKAKGDELAKLTIEEIANKLSENQESAEEGNYCKMQFLANTSIQSVMLQRFYKEIEIRKRAIDYLTQRISPIYISQSLQNICQAIDYAVALMLIKTPGIFDNNEFTDEVTSKSIIKLYDQILSVRELSYEKHTHDDTSFCFSLPSTDANAMVIEKLREALPEDGKCRKADEIIKAYDQYLVRHTDEKIQNNAREFEKYYQGLKAYVDQDEDISAYERKVREELTRYAEDIFKDLMHIDHIYYTYETFDSENLMDLYTKVLLKNCHINIMNIVSKPFNLIERSFALRAYIGRNMWLMPAADDLYETWKALYNKNFEGFDKSDFLFELSDMLNQIRKGELKKVIIGTKTKSATSEDLYNDLIKEIDQLKTEYMIELPQGPDDIEGILKFLEIFKNNSVPFGGAENINKESLIYYLKHYESQKRQDIFERLFSATVILLIECSIIVYRMVEQAVSDLLNTHKRLLAFYRRFSENE